MSTQLGPAPIKGSISKAASKTRIEKEPVMQREVDAMSGFHYRRQIIRDATTHPYNLSPQAAASTAKSAVQLQRRRSCNDGAVATTAQVAKQMTPAPHMSTHAA